MSLLDMLLNEKHELETGKTNAVNAFYKIKGAAGDLDDLPLYTIDLRGFIYDLGNPYGPVDDAKSVNKRLNMVADVWYGDINKSTRRRVLSHLDDRLVDPDGADGCETVTSGDVINSIKTMIGGLKVC